MDDRIFLMNCKSYREILDRLPAAMEQFRDLFPADKGARILIKPNLNSNMNALTGNTTDLRLLSALLSYLKTIGYSNITIGEGTNSGFYRNRIGVISRLGIDRLARYYGVGLIDLNYAEPRDVNFKNGVIAKVAKECFEADMFINLPKLKTHFENGMSVCLKNMMGCLVGQENKKKTHDDLPENILRLNQAVKPHLHIVDALIAMEGLGPTRGTPVRLDTIIVGTDPYLLDLLCCRITEFPYQKVRTLALAEKKGLLTKEHHSVVNRIADTVKPVPFKHPVAGPFATFIHHPKRQKFFLKIRNTPFFTYLAATDWFGSLLFLTGLRQDVFLKDEMRIDTLSFDDKKCDRCGVCRDICPMGRFFPDDFKTPGPCLKCLYCYAACPEGAISYTGEAGFFGEQERQYGDKIRAMFKKNKSASTNR
jgi:uncharacterized protein (DUF362 family)/ferredoxin